MSILRRRSAQIIERDLGWARIAAEIRIARKAGVKIGLMGQDADRDDDSPLDNIDIGLVNEFGSGDGRVPERSFLRSTADAQREQIAQAKERLWDQIVRGTLTVRQALGQLGAWHRGQVQQTIVRLNEPPNAPSTIARKGSSNPLIDTGQLRRAVNYEVEGT